MEEQSRRRLPLYDGAPTRLPPELVEEILRWLPVKALMRFKSVCRSWKSMIMDPEFARLHGGGFRGILSCNIGDMRYDFCYLNILEEGEKQICGHHAVYCWDYGLTEPVNGLICFFDENQSYLYNIATREILQLPDSSNTERRRRRRSSIYDLGFDPVSKMYKLLRICTPVFDDDDDDDDSCHYEILTFGFGVGVGVGVGRGGDELCWRSIRGEDCAPPSVWSLWKKKNKVAFNRVGCYDGVAYWEFHRREIIIAFVLSTEKFHIFSLPKVGLKTLRFAPYMSFSSSSSSSSSVSPDRSPEFRIISYRFNGNGGQDDQPSSSSSSFSFEFPFPCRHEDINILGILPNGKVVMLDMHLCRKFQDRIFLCVYNPSTTQIETIDVPKIIDSSSGLPLPELYGQSYFEENIVSLRSLKLI